MNNKQTWKKERKNVIVINDSPKKKGANYLVGNKYMRRE